MHTFLSLPVHRPELKMCFVLFFTESSLVLAKMLYFFFIHICIFFSHVMFDSKSI